MQSPALPRQLVICCDGTNNNLTGGAEDTNVVKLAQLMARMPASPSELLFYDPGVGNPGELPGATLVDTLGRKAERLAGLAFGRGVYENMAECYLFLMRHYQPGDEIYIFGFSRGAFTARSVAGLVNQFGILQPQMASMLPTLLHLYFSDRGRQKTKMDAIAKQTSLLFAHPACRQVDIKFVGVWDTVASVGMWPFGAKITALPTIAGKRFLNVRQALALDEHRAQFKPRVYVDDNGIYAAANGQPASLKQLWFRGCHGDVGGGYTPAQTAVSDAALAWLVSEAVLCGLRLAPQGAPLDTQAAVAQALSPPATSLAHSRVHSELHATNLWALTGLTVRDTRQVVMDDGVARTVTPVEHPSVGAVALAFPVDTVWAQARPQKAFWACLVLGLLLLALLGNLLTPGAATGNAAQDLAQIPSQLGPWLQQNLKFAQWQMLWWLDGWNATQGLRPFAKPQWAILWDFALIACYAYALSWLAVPAFARHAGLRRAGDPVPKLLNRLGWALPLAVFADVGENLATWAVIICGAMGWSVASVLPAVLMALCTAGNALGLVGVLLLVCMPPAGRRLPRHLTPPTAPAGPTGSPRTGAGTSG